jgi:hypothetical protein
MKEYCFVCGRDWAGHENPYACSFPPVEGKDKFEQEWSNVVAANNASLSKYLLNLVEKMDRLPDREASGTRSLL